MDKIKELGFEIVHSFPISSYNNAIEEKFRIEDFGNEKNTAFLIGGHSHYFNLFLKACEDDPKILDSENPLDHYVVDKLEQFTKSLYIKSKIYFSHIKDPHYLPMQRMTMLCGLAWLSNSHFCIHPIYGSWFSIRAVMVIDQLFTGEIPKLENSPCQHDCEQNCMKVFDQLHNRNSSAPDTMTVRSEWNKWLELRRACPHGSEYEYSALQTEYHYTKNVNVLKRYISSNQ